VLEVRGRSAADDVAFTVTAATLPLTGPVGGGPVAFVAMVAVAAVMALRRRPLGSG